MLQQAADKMTEYQSSLQTVTQTEQPLGTHWTSLVDVKASNCPDDSPPKIY